jgi:hypothetical protein
MALAYFCSQNSFVYMSHSTFFFGGQVQWIILFYFNFLGEFHTMATKKKSSAKEGY